MYLRFVIRAMFTFLVFLDGIAAFSAEPPWPDDLLRAVYRAHQALARGDDRQEILDRLVPAIEANPMSEYLKFATRLSHDLAYSIRMPCDDQKPYRLPAYLPADLQESICPYHLARSPFNWERGLPRFLNANERDPMSLVLVRDKYVIGDLIPMLGDVSPSRSITDSVSDVRKAVRVCDMAMGAIEYHSKCRFHFNASSGDLFHELTHDVREHRIQHVKNWWEANKETSIAEGIRWQLPHAEFYEKVWMATYLAKIEEDGAYPHREFAIELLRSLVQKNHGHFSAHVAKELAALGDLWALDVISAKWRESLKKPGRVYDSSIVFYLTEYGTEREWQLLHAIAESELDQGVLLTRTQVLPTLINCNKTQTSKHAIPSLGLILSHTILPDDPPAENENLNDRRYGLLIALKATQYLQSLTGEDFGYDAEKADAENIPAVAKAQVWWAKAQAERSAPTE